MFKVFHSSKELLKENLDSSITFARTGNTQYHIGFLHKKTNSSSTDFEHLHLAGHNLLMNEPYENGKHLLISPNIDFRLSRQIAVLCRNIWRQNSLGEIPYGFSNPRKWFKSKNTRKFLYSNSLNLVFIF